MTSTMEQFWIDTITVTNCSRRVHQTQHNRVLKGQADLGNIVRGNIDNNRGIKQIMTAHVRRIRSARSADVEEKPSVY